MQPKDNEAQFGETGLDALVESCGEDSEVGFNVGLPTCVDIDLVVVIF